MNTSLKALKKQLALYKVELTYDDLFYKNFKAWNVEGVITGVKLKINTQNPQTINIGRLYVTSKPFSEHLEIHTEDDIFYIQHTKEKDKNFSVDFHNGSPSIDVEFQTSLNKLADTIEDDETPQILRNIKNIRYYDSGFDLFDTDKQARYLSVKQNNFSIDGSVSKSSKIYDNKLTIQDLVFDPNYPSDDHEKFLDKANIDTGSTSINLDVTFTMKPSQHQLEFIEKVKAQDSNAKTKIVLDSFEIRFNNADFTSSSRHSNVKGYILKEPDTGLLPYVDLNLTMSDYKNYLDHYFLSLNHSINQMLMENPILPIKPIDTKQIEKFKTYVSQFSENGQDLKIHLLREDRGDLLLSGRPMMSILNELQSIFFSNFTEAPSTTPKDRLDARLRNVAK
jgi:hypothetical protein